VSFAERALKFSFSGATAGSFSASGLRAAASVQAMEGRLGVMAQVKIWGLSLGQMSAYSSQIPGAPSGPLGLVPFNLTIEAGDIGGNLSQVISGQIWRSFIDLSNAPESCFNVTVAGTIYQSAATIASNSWSGAQNAEDLIAAICAAATPQLKLYNNGAHAVLRNMSASGSAADQILTIAAAGQFPVAFDGNGVYIWPRGGTRDKSEPIPVGPRTTPRMVGYPTFWEQGIIVTSLFNQQVQVGRQFQVASSLPNAPGLWSIVRVEHELSTMLDGGPWFTSAVCAPPGSSAATGDDDDDDTTD
jgi:hypothetical protein